MDLVESDAALVIALDVGGTSVKSGVAASGGHIVSEPVTTPVDSAADAVTILDTFAEIIQRHIGEIQPEWLLGAGFGFPGPFDYQAGISRIRGLEKYDSLYGIDIGAALRERVDLGQRPIRFRNDAEAAIIGECVHGAGQPYRRVIGVTLGTGFGSAFVVDGISQVSGEGVPENGWLYPQPFHGVRADDYFSIRGFESLLAEAGQSARDVKTAAEMARSGDEAIQRVFERYGADMGTFLTPYAQAFRAGAVLVLGGIAGAYDCFGPALEANLPVPAVTGALGANAALLGAAELVFGLDR